MPESLDDFVSRSKCPVCALPPELLGQVKAHLEKGTKPYSIAAWLTESGVSVVESVVRNHRLNRGGRHDPKP